MDELGGKYIIEPSSVKRDGHHLRLETEDIPTIFDQETIGKYINQEDKDGNFLFEGDVCVIEGYEEEGCFLVCMDDYSRYLLGQFTEGHTPILTYTFANVEAKEIKRIGNIYDNPELLDFTPESYFEEEKRR